MVVHLAPLRRATRLLAVLVATSCASTATGPAPTDPGPSAPGGTAVPAAPAPPTPLVTDAGGEVRVPISGDTAGIHDPAVAKDGDVYRLFSTHGGIRSYHSTDLAHWTRDPDVFATIPSWVHEQLPENPNDLWAPDISWWGGTWHLYYAASVWNGPPTRNSAIGHATSPTLDPADPRFGWTDHGPVVSSRGTFIDATSTDGWNAIDPNVVLDERGTPWLAWGSAFDGIFVQPLAPDGTLAAGSAPTRLARRGAWFAVVEAATMVHHDGAWWLFASYDFCCRGAASNYHVRVGRASALTGPYLDRDGRPLDSPRDGSPLELDGGTKVLTGTVAAPGPGHQAILQDGDRWWIVHHWYDPSRNGESDVAIRPLDWGADGWPTVRGWHP